MQKLFSLVFLLMLTYAPVLYASDLLGSWSGRTHIATDNHCNVYINIRSNQFSHYQVCNGYRTVYNSFKFKNRDGDLMLVPANQPDWKIGTISDTKIEWYLPAEEDDYIQQTKFVLERIDANSNDSMYYTLDYVKYHAGVHFDKHYEAELKK